MNHLVRSFSKIRRLHFIVNCLLAGTPLLVHRNAGLLKIMAGKSGGSWFVFTRRINGTFRPSLLENPQSIPATEQRLTRFFFYHHVDRPFEDDVLLFFKFYQKGPQNVSQLIYAGCYWVSSMTSIPFAQVESKLKRHFSLPTERPLVYYEEVRFDCKKIDPLSNDKSLQEQEIRTGDIILFH